MSKLIVIEGTDCSGKQTQSELLQKRLIEDGLTATKFSFPNYDSPTGKIIGGPYLGKEYICDGWFEEGAANVDGKISSLYYAADRLYNLKKVRELLKENDFVILDRYTYSNMAHQGGKYETAKERNNMYEWIYNLEFKMLELPEADIKIFLHMPYEVSCILKKGRKEKPDQNESSPKHLKDAERAYLEVAKKYNFYTIPCNKENEPRSIKEINNEIYSYVRKR